MEIMYSEFKRNRVGVELKNRVTYRFSASPILYYTILLLLIPINLLVSCTNDESATLLSGDKDAVIRFQINADTPKDATTRSVDEDKISDLHVLVYNSAGELTGKSYTTFSETTYTVSVLARSGTGCKIYVIANTGNSTLFDGDVVGTENKLKAMTTNLATWSTFNNTSGTVYLPMSGSVTTDISAGTTSLQGGITVKRLMARITLNVGIAAGSGITISGYRAYGIPGRSYYVGHPLATEEQTTDTQTTRAEDASLPANPTNWTNSGLVSLSNVTSFSTSFYMYENRAGVNTVITAQNQKIKANVPGTPADSAAYVMIYGKGGGYSSLSWKIYLGANNTSNFNLKRNNQYTYSITLRANRSDTRIAYNPKLIWAGSNIYWDGTKLTFDSAPVDPANPTTQELVNQQKQGVFFKWGSLVGTSPDAITYGSSVILYVPSYNSTTPLSSGWQTQNGSQMSWSAISYFTDNLTTGGQTSTFLNDDAQNTDTYYAAYMGDICQYLSRTGAVNGNWRMPTTREYNPDEVGDRVFLSWSEDDTGPWTTFGSFDLVSGNAQGTTLISSGCTYMLDGNRSNFSPSGFRDYTNGDLARSVQTGEYWTSSAYSGTEYAYYLHFGTNLSPSFYNPRSYGFVIRCVQN